MAKSPTEQIRDLSTELVILRERDAAHRREIEELKTHYRHETLRREAADEKPQGDVAELKSETAHLRQENAVLKQQLQDHIKQVEVWDGRRWGLFVLLVGAVLSLSSGLVISLSRK